MRPISEYREALAKAVFPYTDAGNAAATLADTALDELESLRKEVNVWRTARTHGGCHEDLRAMRSRAIDAEDGLDAARERIAALEGQVGVLREALTRVVSVAWLGCQPDRGNMFSAIDDIARSALASTAPTTEGPSDG